MFDCRTCAAAPALQGKFGCFDELKEPIVELNGFSYSRCPVVSRSAKGLYLQSQFQLGALDSSYSTKTSWTPKFLAGLHHIKYLNDLKTANDN